MASPRRVNQRQAGQRQSKSGAGRQAGGAAKPGVSKPGAARPAAARAGAGKPGPAKPGPAKASPAKASPANASAGKPGAAGSRADSGSSRAGAGSAPAGPAQAGQGGAPSWVWLSTFIVSLAGLGVSIYLTIEHFTANTLAGCAENATINCTKVTTSAQSEVFGVFPVAVLGLAFFVFMVAVNSPWGWRMNLPIVRWARLGSVVVGIGFVLYLVYAELFQIQAICLYCTAVHVLTFLLFAIVVFDATFRPAPRAYPRVPAER
jgi:uncharacterized membrane protein